ncbi:MAG: hypothetical protein KAS66_13295 [Candidatus Omnitrophica bacterium]|nr:hypothetical protein [Candidatus Omnitrophota bacterium]
MGKGSSSSASTSQVQNISEDNRVVSEGGGIALAKGASYNYNEVLPDSVVSVFSDLVELSRDTISTAGDAILTQNQESLRASSKALDAVSQTIDKTQKTDNTALTEIFPWLAVAIVGVVAVGMLTRGKR